VYNRTMEREKCFITEAEHSPEYLSYRYKKTLQHTQASWVWERYVGRTESKDINQVIVEEALLNYGKTNARGKGSGTNTNSNI
jgi:hypothetical protein